MSTHVSHEVLQLLADGELTGDAAKAARLHVNKCGSCARFLEAQKQFNRRLRSIPGPRLPQEFTDTVLSGLGIPPRVPFLYRAFEHVASIVAVFVVVAMGGTIWALLSLAAGESDGGQPPPAHRVIDAVEKWFANFTAPVGNWLQSLSLHMPGGLASKVVVMLLLMVTVVAVIDWLIQRKGTASGV